MVMVLDVLPKIKAFLKLLPFRSRAAELVGCCMVAFVMHWGKMSAAQAAGAVRTAGRHRAQMIRLLGRKRLGKGDPLAAARELLLAFECRRGKFLFIVDQTFMGQQGQKTENTFSRANYQPRKRKGDRKQKKRAKRSCHGFVMGLLITPSGIRIPFSKPYYTQTYCKEKGRTYRTQVELAAELIRELPVPEEADVLVLGDTAFDAKTIREACAERSWHWIVPLNPERVIAGAKPRPKVRSLAASLPKDGWSAVRIDPGKEKLAAYRRPSRCRIGSSQKLRTYYVQTQEVCVHSVGTVLLAFSTAEKPQPDQPVIVQKILMTNDRRLSPRALVEWYQLRWQIELFFKEMKSTLGMHHYRLRRFEKVERWVTLALLAFCYLEWLRARQLKAKSLTADDRQWWQAQRTTGLCQAVRQWSSENEIEYIAEALQTPFGIQRLKRQIRTAPQKEQRVRCKAA